MNTIGRTCCAVDDMAHACRGCSIRDMAALPYLGCHAAGHGVLHVEDAVNPTEGPPQRPDVLRIRSLDLRALVSQRAGGGTGRVPG